MAKKAKFPPQVYVVREDQNDGTSYLAAMETTIEAAELGEVREVAIYTLHRIAKVTTKVELK